MNAPNETDLRESMQHVAFEFYHFELYGKLIQRWINGNMTYHSGLYQAVGYEFLIHFRALLDFFFAVGGNPYSSEQFAGLEKPRSAGPSWA